MSKLKRAHKHKTVVGKKKYKLSSRKTPNQVNEILGSVCSKCGQILRTKNRRDNHEKKKCFGDGRWSKAKKDRNLEKKFDEAPRNRSKK